MKKLIYLILFLVLANYVVGYIWRAEPPEYDIDKIVDYENFTENFKLAEGYNYSGSISAEDIDRDIATNCPTDTYQTGNGNNMSTRICSGLTTSAVNGTIWNKTGNKIYPSDSDDNLVMNGSGRFLAPVGSVSVPSYSFADDTDTGLYRYTANGWGLAAGGIVSIRGDQYGVLVASGTAAFPSYSFDKSAFMGFYRISPNVMGISTSGVKRVRIDDTGVNITGNLVAKNITGENAEFEELNVTGNITLGDKITFRLGGIIDNIKNGIIKVTIDLFNVSGNIIAENVFLPQYIFSHTNETIPVRGANLWTNVTISQEDSDIKRGITHTYNDNTNHTFTLSADGIYYVSYDLDLIDTSASASNIDIAGRLTYANGSEIKGSVFEEDITKQGTEVELSHEFLAELRSGDVLVFQFVADDADVEISTHGTFGDYPESASIIIKKEYNLP